MRYRPLTHSRHPMRFQNFVHENITIGLETELTNQIARTMHSYVITCDIQYLLPVLTDSRRQLVVFAIPYLCVWVNLSYCLHSCFHRFVHWCLRDHWAGFCQTIGYLELKDY